MNSKNKFSTLILFPLSLVIFELTVYTANDMIQPAMIEIIKSFNTDIKWVPTTLTAYLAGGISLQWLFGPLSDTFGRRPVMLTGIIFFIFACLSTFLVFNIQQFIIIRFLQGIGLCFIGSVGYAVIQEIFEEKLCIKIIALMANISLIAPLFGPLAGAALLQFFYWKSIFLFFSAFSFISFIGLLFFMPETIIKKNKFSIKLLISPYKKIIKNIKFIFGSLTIGLANIPLLSWIALSPLILINEKKISIIHYAILQIPVFSGLIIGNMYLSYFVKKINLLKLIEIGSKIMLLGIFLSFISCFKTKNYFFTILSLSIYSCGLGINNACLTRITLFSSKISKGTVSAAMSMISMLLVIIGIELSKKLYILFSKNLIVINLFNFIVGCIWFILFKIFINKFFNTLEYNKK